MNLHLSAAIDMLATAPATIDVLHGLDAFEALGPEWDDLFRRAAMPHQLFQSHAVLSAWARSYPGHGGIVLITARQHGLLVGVLPITQRQNFGIRRLQIMGMPVAQFADMLLDPDCQPETAGQIWDAVRALGADILEVRRMRADSVLWQFEKGSIVTEKMSAPFACLHRRVDGATPGAAYSARDRSNLRRRVRRLEERGQFLTRTMLSGDAAVELAGRAIDIKRRALKSSRVVVSPVKTAEFQAFFRLAAANPDSGLMVSSVEVVGRIAAIDLSFLCKGTAFGHVLAVEPDFQKDGVGSMLVHHVFASAKAAGARTFDLLAPADPYKLHHADGATAVESRVYPFSLRGRLFADAFNRLALPAARALLR